MDHSIFPARNPFHLPRSLPALLRRAAARRASHSAPAQSWRGELAREQTVWLEEPRQHEIVCERGTLWLTFDGQLVDIILEAGQFHRCTCDARLAIHALSAATCRIDPPGQRPDADPAARGPTFTPPRGIAVPGLA